MRSTILKSILIGIIGWALFGISSVSAKECHSVYGGGEVCDYGDISIDKQVLNPEKNEYWDNIDSSDYIFAPEQAVTFKITIKNTSDKKIDKVVIRDFMTDYLTFVSGGNWNSDDNKTEWSFTNLEAGKSETVYVNFRTVVKESMTDGIVCLTNKAEAEKENGDKKSDTSSFCISKDKSTQVLGATMPETGVSFPMVIALELMGIGIIGSAYYITASKKAGY